MSRTSTKLALTLLCSGLAVIWLLSFMAQPTRVMAKPLLTSRTYPGAAPCDTTLQACIDGSSDGDVINILAGTYNNSVTLNKAVSLIGANSSTTILSALASQRVMTVTGASINNSTIISGLMFTGGNANTGSFSCPQDCGGGILLTSNAQPLIQNVVISNNVAYQGGGLYADSGTVLTLNNVSVISNTAGDFGGGVTTLGPATLNGGLFQKNFSSSDGGGLDAESTLNVIGTRFIDNIAAGFGRGGGVFAFGAATFTSAVFQNNHTNVFGGSAVYLANDARIVNVLFARNATSSNNNNGAVILLNTPTGTVQILHSTIASPSVQGSAAIYVTAGTVGITNTIVASHTVGISNTGGVAYQNYNLFFGNTTPYMGTIGGTNNTSGDPKFVNPAGDDYHLSAGSAAIDAGTNVGVTSDLDGNPRPFGSGFDIGAYEASFTGTLKLYLPLIAR